jgi:hypothetical protein
VNEALVEQPVPMPEMMTGFGLKVIVGPVVGVGVGVGTAVGVGVGVGTGVGVGLGVGVGVGLGVGVGVGLAVGVPVGAAVGLVVGRDVGGVDEALPPDPLHCANMTERAAMTQSVERESVRFTRASFTKRRVDA